MSENPLVAEHWDIGNDEQRTPMPTTEQEKPAGYDYVRDNGEKVFVQDCGAHKDGTRDEQMAGVYLIYLGGYHDGDPDGDFTAPEPLPYPSALQDLSEQYLDQIGHAEPREPKP